MIYKNNRNLSDCFDHVSRFSDYLNERDDFKFDESVFFFDISKHL